MWKASVQEKVCLGKHPSDTRDFFRFEKCKDGASGLFIETKFNNIGYLSTKSHSPCYWKLANICNYFCHKTGKEIVDNLQNKIIGLEDLLTTNTIAKPKAKQTGSNRWEKNGRGVTSKTRRAEVSRARCSEASKKKIKAAIAA